MYSKFLLIFTCVLSTIVYGQKFTSSPFSSYGLGEIGGMDNANFSGIGNNKASIIDSLNLNYFNPSSYSFLGSGQPLFSLGVSYKNSKFSENSGAFNSNLVGLNHFALAVPFRKVFGLAFGLKPFSSMGFEVSENQAFGTDTLQYKYYGTGSINNAFTGLSVKVLDHKNHKIGIGSNFSYLFGSVNSNRSSNLSTQISGGLDEKKTQVKSIYYNLGFNYQLQINPSQKLTLGATLTPSQKIKASRNSNLYYLLDVSNFNSITDTLTSRHENGEISMPSTFDLGFTYSFRPKTDSSYNKVKVYQLNIYGSYQAQQWQDYQSNFYADSAIRFSNASKISFGMEFMPHYQFLERSKSIKYFSRVRYRAGFQYAKLPYSINNVQLVNSGITFGLSLPIISQRSVSSINLGFSYGSVGNGNKTDFSEKYTGFNVGITIAPGAYDRWFRKYKID